MKTVITTIVAPGNDPVAFGAFDWYVGNGITHYDFQGGLIIEAGTEIRIRRINGLLIISAASTRKKVQP